MTKKQTVQIAEAKGRPMLHWVGKRALDHVTAFPAQLVERFDPLGEQTSEVFRDLGGLGGSSNLLFHGDNKDVLAWLLAHGYRGKVNLIYIDPPFDSGADYVRRVQLRGVRTLGFEGEAHSLGEQIQYTDIWANDMYLQFMYERLMLLKELLAVQGYIVVHINTARVHYVKAIMDEVFGEANFRNEILVKRIRKSYTEPSGITSLNEGCDYLLLYSKSPESRLKPPLKYDPKEERWHGFDAPNIRPNLTYELFGKMPPPGRCWMRSPEEADKMIEQDDLRPNPSTGWPEYRIPASEYIVRDTLWNDITASAFSTGYPTEKKEQMLEIILQMASNPADVILDCFIGSGTAAAVAQKLGRRWIAADINKGAIQTTSKRLQTNIREQIKTSEVSGTSEVSPAALSFSVYRVNDYDMQIQHNEAVNLAVELIGIERIKTDIFFDGTLGRRLVKIVPFNHPLTPLDLQLLQDEFKARPDEERDVVVVCLGQEMAVDAWLEEYNKRRPVNKIEVIELRTDQKYGKFFVHQPAQAQVRVERQTSKVSETSEVSEVLVVEIEDFISPTIVERLEMDTPLFEAQIPDWRAMVDVVLVDTAYDGEVFNITLSDVPEKKNDLVSGHYELVAPDGPTTVAVKIIDMLGEEVLVTAEV